MVAARSACLVATLATLLGGELPAQAGHARFVPLGDLPGGAHSSVPRDVSDDGSVVVGASASASGSEAFRWDGGVMTGLGDLPGGRFASQANSVSADGSVVVGYGTAASNDRGAVLWSDGAMIALGDLAGGGESSEAKAVSADGSTVVGQGRTEFSREAFRWRAGVMEPVRRDGIGGSIDDAEDVSADGSVIVGTTASSFASYDAYRWEEGRYTRLGDLPGGGVFSEALAVSRDGSIAVGYSRPDGTEESFLWRDGVMFALGHLHLGSGHALDVSADGSVVVGNENTYTTAFVWDAANGMRNLRNLLIGDFGLDLTGWWLLSASAVSADGTFIVGRGTNPAGESEGWLVELPPACDDGLDNDGDGFVDLAADPDCASASARSERPACSDGGDNDLDGAADHPDDPGCTSSEDAGERSESLDCDDGVDNDGDGLADFPFDPGCLGWPGWVEDPACDDGIDNDSDGSVDAFGGPNGEPADPACTGDSWKSSERRRACGLGIEPTLALWPLAWWHRKGRPAPTG